MREHKRDFESRRESQISSQRSGGSVLPFISGMGLGAGIMYVLDPDRGNRRRAMAQQKLFRLANLAGDALDKGVRDLEHRAEGVAYEAVHLVRRERCSDEVLEQRVRSKLGRVACHPGSIEVRVRDGNVVLTGPVLRGECHEIERAVRHVRAVRNVECHVEEHDSSENIPGLQGLAQRPGDKPELLQENWAPGTRLVMGGLGLALVWRALRSPGFLNSVTGVLGVGLLVRSGRRTRVFDTLMDSIRPGAGPRAGRASVALQSVLKPGEIARDQWRHFFGQLSKAIAGQRVAVEVHQGSEVRVQQRDMPIDSIGADIKDRESIVTVSVGRSADDLVFHTINARRVAVREDSDSRLLEIEGNDGIATVVRFRNSDLQPTRIVA